MERRGRPRSKSATRKPPPTGKSPRGRPRKTTEEKPKREPSRSRTRAKSTKKPAKEVKETKTRRERSRSRSVSGQSPASARPKRTPRKRDEISDDDQPLLVLNDIAKNNSGGRLNLNDVIRRSLSRDVTSDNNVLARETIHDSLRRSTRVSERGTKKKTEQWSYQSNVTETKSVKHSKIEFGGSLGALLSIIGFFIIIVGILLGCTKEQCTLQPFHIPRNWRVYLNVEAAATVVGFVLIQALLLILPIGRVVKSPTGSTYRANGLLALALSCGLVGLGWYLGFPVTLVYERWIPLATSAYILAWILAVVLYIKGGRASVPGLNPYGNSGQRINDFYVGREINPVILKVNIKVLLLRICIISSILIDGILALKCYEVRKSISPTLQVAVGLQIWYCLDYLWFEESYASTFETQNEAVGLMSAQSLLLYPFLSAVIPRFILTHRVELSVYAVTTSVAAYLVGYFIYRASNLQKAAFRKNPLDPNISHLETISTNRGKKLLVSGYWGVVKHPNYVGDIILHWAVASTIGFTHALPYVAPLMTTLLLLHRAKRDDKRCRERYQGAWEEYSRRVPYSILPRVY